MKKLAAPGIRIFYRQSFAIGALLATAPLLLTCVVPADSPVETLHVENCASSDTVSPYGEIRLAFSIPAGDSGEPRFDFSPPFFSYTVTMNATRDTAHLAWSSPLAGAQRYAIRIDEFRTESGDLMSSNDSIIVVTYPMEQEPNSAPETADTLTTSRWGAIATVNDTDWFTATGRPGDALLLNSEGSQTSLAVMTRGGMLGPERTFRKNDTLLVADSFLLPLLIAVFAYHRSVGGYYEIRLASMKE